MLVRKAHKVRRGLLDLLDLLESKVSKVLSALLDLSAQREKRVSVDQLASEVPLVLLVRRATRAKLVRKVLLGNEDQLAKEVLLVLSDHKALLDLLDQRATLESVDLLALLVQRARMPISPTSRRPPTTPNSPKRSGQGHEATTEMQKKE